MKRILAITLCLVLLLALCACGESGTKSNDKPTEETAKPLETPEPTPEPTPAPASAVGYYSMTGASGEVSEDGTTGEDLIATMEALGIKIYLVVEDGGTAYLDVMGSKTQLAWDDSEFWFVESEEDTRLGYELNGGVLLLSNPDGSMEFTPLNAEDLAHYLEYGSAVSGWGEDDDEIPEGDPSVGPVSGTMRGCRVKILGAEATEDDDGEPCLRFYYEFTNDTDEITSANMLLDIDAWQDGEKLDQAYIYGDNSVPEDDYSYLDMLPGRSIRTTSLFYYNPDGGTITFRFHDWFGTDRLYYFVDPQNPSGAPEDSFIFAPMTDIPAMLRDLPTYNDEIEITQYEYTSNYSDEMLIRFYFDYTNKSGEETSCYMNYSISAYQDGYELSSGYATWTDDVDSDNEHYTSIAADKTITCSACFELRSDSPVVFVIERDSDDALIGYAAEDVPYPVTGEYYLDNVMGYSIEEYAELAEVDPEDARELIMLTLSLDGTGVWTNQGDDYDITWSFDGETLTVVSEGTDEVLYGTLEDGGLYFEIEDAYIILRR